MKTIRSILQSARNKKGLTQQQVADKLGIALRSYQHYEYEERKIPLVIAADLSTILDINIYDLVVRNSTPNNESA
ncbi:helix-turn-helix transcriptional regulator [Alicyclobacillus tolerans]|uniref:helix-turn-helix transcriptional regulator n=1 Tax=Alicyclobacillus tolerans TaxID=90970 RepID=UPI003B777B26